MALKYRSFGAELEYGEIFEDIQPIFTKAVTRHYSPDAVFCRNSNFRSAVFDKWTLKQEDEITSEIVTPISYYSDMQRICKVIGEFKDIYIGDNSGFHVHVWANDIPVPVLLLAWLQFEPWVFQMFPPCRRHNQFCRRISQPYDNRIIGEYYYDALDSLETSQSICFLHYWKNGKENTYRRPTAEIRIAESTTNPIMIRNWIKFCILFINYAARMKDSFDFTCSALCNPPFTPTEAWKELCSTDTKLKSWLQRRYRKYRLN